MPSRAELSAVIVTHNRCNTLQIVIRAVLQSAAVGEVIVVVDGSNDGSLEMLDAIRVTDSRVKPYFTESQGGPAARQRGVELAAGPLVILLDDDVMVAPGAIEGHIQFHAGHDRAVLLGYMPVRLPQRRRGRDFYSYLYQADYEEHARRWERDPSTILDFFWAGHLSIRRADALVVGLCAAGERLERHADRAFGWRCKAAGLSGYFQRQLTSEHLFSRDLGAFARASLAQGRSQVQLANLEGVDSRETMLPTRGIRAKLWLWATANSVVAMLIENVLRGGVYVSGQARLFALQAAMARRLHHLNKLRGIRAALESRA